MKRNAEGHFVKIPEVALHSHSVFISVATALVGAAGAAAATAAALACCSRVHAGPSVFSGLPT